MCSWTRIVANDLENIPVGLVAAWASALLTKSGNLNLHLAGVIMLGVGRLGHTYCYAYQLGRPRTASYAIGVVGTLLMLVQILLAVF